MPRRTIALLNTELRSILLAALSAPALLLGACAQIDMPSQIRPERVQLETQNYSERYATADVDASRLDAIAENYSRYGSGEAEVIVGYDPRSRHNTAMKATDELHRVMSELSRRGVDHVKGSILAVENSGDQSEMMVGYASLKALPPEDCRMMPGYETNQAMADFDYKLGCSVETMVSRQVSRPADLAGRAPETEGDGRRNSAVVEPYRAGQPLPALSGESASGG